MLKGFLLLDGHRFYLNAFQVTPYVEAITAILHNRKW